MVELGWACFALVCLITVSSLALVNSLGDSLRDENSGGYQYRTRRRELRKEISKYPTVVSYIYFSVVVPIMFLVILEQLSGVKIPSDVNKIEWLMVIFSVFYVVWILRRITKFCSGFFKDFVDDKYDLNSKE